ncbi:MAG: hypothetical protein JSS43_27820 [Proteobacteria bacterium]|nr:hypothetical protein [Pseudomonadota bacterium]
MHTTGSTTRDLYHPATFQERGIAVAFTTPMLAGARVRDNGRRGKELVMHNPSGGRGVYVIPLRGVGDHFRPTVHDTLLLRRLETLVTLSPATVRQAVWSIALDGFAGPAARAAAEAVAEADHSQAMMTEFHLLAALVEQVEPSGEPMTDAGVQVVDLRRRGRGALTRFSRSFGRSGYDLGKALSDLAVLLAPVGAGPTASRARLALLLERVRQTRDDILDTFTRIDSNAGGTLGKAIVASADTMLSCASTTLATARALAADPITLLVRWFANRPEVLATVGRPEWFLDGWEQISLLWRAGADRHARLAALFEMAQIIPLLPREAMQWSPMPLAPASLTPNIHVASHKDDWRTGSSALLLIDRNERMRAMSL